MWVPPCSEKSYFEGCRAMYICVKLSVHIDVSVITFTF